MGENELGNVKEACQVIMEEQVELFEIWCKFDKGLIWNIEQRIENTLFWESSFHFFEKFIKILFMHSKWHESIIKISNILLVESPYLQKW